MTFLITIILALSAALAAWRKRPRVGWSLGLLTVLSVLVIGCGPLPALLLAHIQRPFLTSPSPTWSQHNAIVLLGAGANRLADTTRVEPDFFAYGRIEKAAITYRQCRAVSQACLVIISGGDARRTGEPESSAYAAHLVDLGVPPSDIVQESKSMNTWKNAEYTSALLRRHGVDHVALVSSGVHLARSLLYFQHFGVSATPVRADYLAPTMSWLPLAINFAAMDVALHEVIGTLRYRLYERLGWNAESVRAGAL